MSKFEKLEPKNPKYLHFCSEKVTKLENYVISKVHFFMNLVPLCSVQKCHFSTHVKIHHKHKIRAIKTTNFKFSRQKNVDF